jgi:hypothetical protein
VKHRDKPYIPNSAVIVTTILFFPVAGILLLVRLIAHWKSPLRRIRDVKLGAGIIISLFIIIIIAVLMNPEQEEGTVMDLIMVLIMFVLPPLIIYMVCRSKERKVIYEYEAYRINIFEQRLSTVNQIASTMGKTPNRVIIDIKDMIRQHLLPGVDLDPHSQIITITQDTDQEQPPLEEQEAAPNEPPAPSNGPSGGPLPPRIRPVRSVECRGCGNRAQLAEGEIKNCEYCGTLLQ